MIIPKYSYWKSNSRKKLQLYYNIDNHHNTKKQKDKYTNTLRGYNKNKTRNIFYSLFMHWHWGAWIHEELHKSKPKSLWTVLLQQLYRKWAGFCWYTIFWSMSLQYKYWNTRHTTNSETSAFEKTACKAGRFCWLLFSFLCSFFLFFFFFLQAKKSDRKRKGTYPWVKRIDEKDGKKVKERTRTKNQR